VTFKRVRYFQGQLLGESDFQSEQRYLLDKQRARNRFLYGAGIVEGLTVAVETECVVISPGMAIDAAGNEIYVAEPVRIPLPEKRAWFVTVRFAERLTDLVPSAEGMEASRVEEYAVVELTAAATDAAIAVARVVLQKGQWFLDRHFSPRRSRCR